MNTLGPYQLIERLGVGGMAEVFLAHAQRQGGFVQPCVVKVLHRELAADESFTRLLLEEARLIARLRHNNIASLYDVGQEKGTLFLVMEFIDGRDLHNILATSVRNERPLPIAFAIHVARDLCTGLHFAHTRRSEDGKDLNLVHRDVSPQNVLVSVLGEVKLIDFGVAKFNSNMRQQTRAGVIKGKFGYMSPEQAFDEPLDQRSDIFSVGICLYEMLTGRSVYGQNDDAMTMLKRAREAAIDPVTKWRSDVPEDLARLVHRALERNRDKRFQTAHEFERELTSCLSRYAPDFTNLDAGAIINELFHTGEPALEHLSPRIAQAPSSRSGQAQTPPPSLQHAPVAESTQPMAEVPEPIRKSGAYLSPTVDEIDAEEPTRLGTFREDAFVENDFAEEKTELFDENRISGAYATLEKARPKSSPISGPSRPLSDKARTRDPAHSTRKIQDRALEEQKTDPRRDTPKLAASGSFDAFDGSDVLTEERPPISRTDHLPTVSREEAYRAAGQSEQLPAAPAPSGDSPLEIFQDRRVQIACGVAFVIFALILVLARLF